MAVCSGISSHLLCGACGRRHRHPPAFLFGGQEGLAAFRRLDYAAFGPVGGFVAVTAIFPFFLAGILIAVTLVPGLVWTVVSLIDGTTELAIGAHFANNIGGNLLVGVAGSTVNAPALFTISKFHATYTALSMLVVVPVFLAIAYGVFKRDKVSEPVSQSDRKGRR